MSWTASEANRVAICPTSAILPRARREGDRAPGIGRVIHAFLVDVNKLGREAALERVPEGLRDRCAAIDLATLPLDPSAFAPEVTLSIDLATGQARELGRCLDRDYPAVSATERVGTADLIGIGPDHVYVLDWKSGFGDETYAPPTVRNRQLRMLCLAAARTYGKDRATAEIIHIADNGKPWRDRADLDAFDLDDVLSELRDIAKRVRAARAVLVEGGTPDVVLGDHCRWCPSVHACPGQKSLALALASNPGEIAHEVLTNENAAKAFERVKMARRLLDRVESAIYAYAAQSPITLSDGKVLGPVEKSKETILGNIARDVLARLTTQEIADAACSFETSKAAIRRVLQPVAGSFGLSLAALERKVLEEIRTAGGVEVRTSWPVEVHKPDGKGARALEARRAKAITVTMEDGTSVDVGAIE